MITKSLEDVRLFWDSNPLFTGEVKEEVGSEEWFRKLDEIKTRDVFLGNLERWIPGDIRGKKMLDIGCGPGYWQRRFAQTGVLYQGVDISPVSVALARKSQEMFNLPGSTCVGNAEKLEFADASFDYCLSEGVIHHTPDTNACIQEIYRVLKPSGRATFSVYYKSILIRFPMIFRISQFLMRILSVGLSGRARENHSRARSVSEFVRMYDGGENPIGKAYSIQELNTYLKPFRKIKYSLYYFPSRAFNKIPIPYFVQRIISQMMGLLVCIEVQK
ncbi:MAG: class I SAM-dependent methyltransferase [Candidatus Riflebacteria bacterium]|nr:class I SAM-dependent methyltransferase [Candidatus Riflebacteria bacterium]